MDSLSDIFRDIGSELPLGLILLLLAVTAFRIGARFHDKEESQGTDSVNRIAELVSRFRRENVQPLIEGQLQRAWLDGRHSAIADLEATADADLPDNTNDESQEPTTDEANSRQSVKDYVRSFLAEVPAPNQFQRRIDRFLESGSGDALFDGFDEVYDRRSKLVNQCNSMLSACVRVAYGLYALGLLLTIGVTQALFEWNAPSFWSWVFLCGQSVVYAVYQFVRYEIYRRIVFDRWMVLRVNG